MTKTAKALETLKAGGYFRKALERSYLGGEKFKTRLYTAGGEVVKGIGEVTFYAMLDAKALRSRECIRSSAYAQEWDYQGEGGSTGPCSHHAVAAARNTSASGVRRFGCPKGGDK